MKSFIICLVFLSTSCYCDQLLGGWSNSDDESLHKECLNKALVHIHGAEVNDDIKSQASDLSCKTQIVNGLNIKCHFVLRNQKWQCSYYKSFISTLDLQLEKCKQVENQQMSAQNGDEQAVEELPKSNEGEKEEQSVVSREDEEEKQSVVANEGEKEEQVLKEGSLPNEEDDEAKIDAINKQNSEHNTNNEEEQ